MKPMIILTFVFAMIVSTAQSQDNFNVTKVGSYLAGRDVKDVTISGDYAFCADDYGLSVWDLSEPENLIDVARCPTPGWAWSIDIHENYVYVGDYWEGLSIFDISDPTHPQLVNEIEIRYRADYAIPRLQVYVHNKTLYYLSSPLGLFVFSLEDPVDPALIGRYLENTNLVDIDVRENLAYISYYHPDNILIMNIDHPEELEMVARIELDFEPRTCDIQGEILALGDLRNHILYIFSIEDPLSPEFLGQCDARAGAIKLKDNFAYLSANMVNIVVQNNDFTVVDITSPDDPRIVGILEPHGGEAIAIRDDIAYTTSRWQGLMAVSIENPEDPVLVNEPLMRNHYVSLDVADGIAYTQNLSRGLEIIDVSELEDPGFISRWDRDHLETDTFIFQSTKKHDNYIYMGSCRSLSFLDVEDINNPERVSNFSLVRVGSDLLKMYILDDYLYVVGSFREDLHEDRNLLAFDIENPAEPEVAFWRNELDFGFHYSSIDNNILYQVAKDNPGSGDHYVLVYDVEDPSRPRYRGRWRSGSYETMLVHNQVAYIYFDDAINIYTVEDPTEPDQVGSLQMDREITDICIDGEVIYLSADIFGFYCMSIENPTDPEIVGYYDTPGRVYECQGSDGYLYVCDDYELGIYDCAEIHGIWNLQLGEESHDFGEVVVDSYSVWHLIITNEARQPVDILDISCDSAAFTVDFDDTLTIDPDEETTVDVTFTPAEQRPYTDQLTIYTERRNLTVDLSGTGVDLAVSEDDLLPLEFSLKPAYPNPFNSSTTITYGLAEAAPARIAIYDLSGREIAVLYDDYETAGTHSVSWDASDLPSGVYLCRMQAGKYRNTIKLALIR